MDFTSTYFLKHIFDDRTKPCSNPSFEDTVACPNAMAQVANAVGWSSFRDTPDYFNTCGTGGSNVPSNTQGYQYAHTGNSYCGSIIFARLGFYREIIGSQLLSPLVVGQKYSVSFYANLTIKPPNHAFGANKLGAKFSTILYDAFTNQMPINNIAPLHYDTIITDTANWTFISGSFIADSAYNYIAIGNFFDDVNTDTIRLGGGALPIYAYYYIDDIYVAVDSSGEGVNEFNIDNYFSVYPNPTAGAFTITTDEATIKNIEVINVLGEKVQGLNVFTHTGTIDLSSQPDGIYFVRVNTEKEMLSRKVVVVR